MTSDHDFVPDLGAVRRGLAEVGENQHAPAIESVLTGVIALADAALLLLPQALPGWRTVPDVEPDRVNQAGTAIWETSGYTVETDPRGGDKPIFHQDTGTDAFITIGDAERRAAMLMSAVARARANQTTVDTGELR